MGDLFRGGSPPQSTAEFWRVASIPRRIYSASEQETIRQEMTKLLRRPGGQGELWTSQAVSLFDLSFAGGLVGAIPAGNGKTLISLLAPTVWRCARPVLLVPAALVEKTKRAYRELSAHWRMSPSIRVWSYEWLGRTGAKQALDEWRPDIIVADEGHYLANTSAGVTRRVGRYLKANPETIFAVMSGTISKRSVLDYAHLVEWAFRRSPISTPVPLAFQELVTWASVIDEGAAPDADPGILWHLCNDEEQARGGLSAIRSAYRRRLTETQGFVQVNGGDGEVTIPLIISTTRPDLPRGLAEALREMRDSWQTPDGVEFLTAMERWRHCRELALGFYYRWTTQPPPEWREARKAWAATARWIVEHGRKHVDTVLDASLAIDRGQYPEYAPILEAWRGIKDTFEPETEAVWLDDHVIKWADHWLTKHKGPHLIWVEHRTMGERLSHALGLPFYCPEDARGRSLLDHNVRQSAILSAHACKQGFDLQWCSSNVILGPLTSARGWEQKLARTHRVKQKADQVTVMVPIWCDEHQMAIDQAISDAHYLRDSLGNSQRLLHADWS
mgnify:CR=1 FL=1